MPHIYIGTQQTCPYTGLEAVGTLVFDIQYRRHLVAVLGIETACRELYILHHVRIHKTQSLLLPATDKQRPVHLYSVHIHLVLVETATPHVVLRREFVVLVHAGKSDEQTLDRTARRIGHHPRVGRLYTLHRAGLSFQSAHLHLLYPLLVGGHFHIDIQHILRLYHTLADSGIAYHRENQFHRVAVGEQQFVVAVLVGCCTGRSSRYGYVCQFHTPVLAIGYIAVYTYIAGKCLPANRP